MSTKSYFLRSVKSFIYLICALVFIETSLPSFAQQQQVPVIVNGAGANGQPLYCQVGNGSAGSCSLPTTGGGGSASGFAPNGTDSTPLSVSNSSSEQALPAASTAVNVFNTGSVTAYVKLGTSGSVTATTSNIAIPSNSGCVLTVGSNTNIAAITASSTTSLNINGGSGLGNFCYGGGGSGNSNVTVTSPLGTQSIANSVAVTTGDGNDVTLGAKADSACATASGTCSLQALVKYLTTAATADPCGGAKTPAHFSSTSSGGNLITGTASKLTYICSLKIITSTASNVSLCEATSTACSGGTPAAVYGNTGTTASNGSSYAANGGEVMGNGGYTIAKTATTGQNVDVLFTTTNSPQVNVDVTYVQQ